MAAPNTMQKKIRASMSALAAACTTLSGTMSRMSWTGVVGVSSVGRLCDVSTMFAPTPGRITFTMNSPTSTASRLDST